MGKMKVKLNKPREQIPLQMEKDSDNFAVSSKQTVAAVAAVLQVLGKHLCHLSALLLQVGTAVPGQRALPSPTTNPGAVCHEQRVIISHKGKCTFFQELPVKLQASQR